MHAMGKSLILDPDIHFQLIYSVTELVDSLVWIWERGLI